MSRRVEITREILGDLVRSVRKQIKDLQSEEDKLLLLIDWYELDILKEFDRGQIVKDNIGTKHL